MTGCSSIRQEDRRSAEELSQWCIEESSTFAISEPLETGIIEIKGEDIVTRDIFGKKSERSELPHSEICLDMRNNRIIEGFYFRRTREDIEGEEFFFDSLDDELLSE